MTRKKPILYRDHKGGFTESMETVQEMTSKRAITIHLNKKWKQLDLEIKEIKFVYLGMDYRNGWDTYCVMQRFKGQENFSVAGMSNGEL